MLNLASSFLHCIRDRDRQKVPGLEERLDNWISDLSLPVPFSSSSLTLYYLVTEILLSYKLHEIHILCTITARIAGDSGYFHPHFGHDAWLTKRS